MVRSLWGPLSSTIQKPESSYPLFLTSRRWVVQIAKPSAGFQERKNWYFVHWFGTAQCGYVRKKDCLQFLEYREHFFAKAIKNQKWTLALEEISKKQEEQDGKPPTAGSVGKKPRVLTSPPAVPPGVKKPPKAVASPKPEAAAAAEQGSGGGVGGTHTTDDRSSRRRLSEGGSARKFPEAVQPMAHDRPPFKRSSKRSMAAAAEESGLTPTGRCVLFPTQLCFKPLLGGRGCVFRALAFAVVDLFGCPALKT